MTIFIIIILTLFNILLFSINVQMIIDFKRNQILFINQQNKNTIDIFDIKDKLEMFS